MAKQPQPFNPEALTLYATLALRCPLGVDTVLIWRYTVFVPTVEYKADGSEREIATRQDLILLEVTLADHFGGISTPTAVPGFRGLGARDPLRPQQSRENNAHAVFIVCAAACGASDRYFLALRRELEEALGEGVILVERQDVTII
jgi:hypothetical protein